MCTLDTELWGVFLPVILVLWTWTIRTETKGDFSVLGTSSFSTQNSQDKMTILLLWPLFLLIENIKCEHGSKTHAICVLLRWDCTIKPTFLCNPIKELYYGISVIFLICWQRHHVMGVIAWTEIASEVLVSNNHIFMYYSNSTSM